MAPTQELELLNKVVDEHADVEVEPKYSSPSARLIVKRSETIGAKPPLVIRRFQDRVLGSRGSGDTGHRNRIARDFHGADYNELTQQQQDGVNDLLGKVQTPAGTFKYLKKGLSFAEAHELLIQSFGAQGDSKLAPEIRQGLIDFRNGLEKDMYDAAKQAGFLEQYSQADKALRGALDGKGAQHQLPEYPKDHQVGMAVPEGGSNCDKCAHLVAPQKCDDKKFVEWNGTSQIPAKTSRECCDFYRIRR